MTALAQLAQAVDIMADLGGLPADARHEAGLTRQQLADRLDVRQTGVARWETGGARPPHGIRRLAPENSAAARRNRLRRRISRQP